MRVLMFIDCLLSSRIWAWHSIDSILSNAFNEVVKQKLSHIIDEQIELQRALTCHGHTVGKWAQWDSDQAALWFFI